MCPGSMFSPGCMVTASWRPGSNGSLGFGAKGEIPWSFRALSSASRIAPDPLHDRLGRDGARVVPEGQVERVDGLDHVAGHGSEHLTPRLGHVLRPRLAERADLVLEFGRAHEEAFVLLGEAFALGGELVDQGRGLVRVDFESAGGVGLARGLLVPVAIGLWLGHLGTPIVRGRVLIAAVRPVLLA